MSDRTQRQLKAVASASRARLLHWLKDPVAHFPRQRDGDLVKDGVCSVFIARKWRVSAATASRHLRVMTEAGLLRAVRRKGWTFYRRDEAELKKLKRRLTAEL